MAAGDRTQPDWRDAAAYAPLLHADRSLLAWEWLRRNPAYRAAATVALSSGGRTGPGADPASWGLHAFEPPDAAVPAARPVWSSALHRFVLDVEARPSDDGDAFDFRRLGPLSTILRAAAGGEHLLLSDGFRTIRLDVLVGTLAHGPVALRVRLGGPGSAERIVLPLRRLLSLWKTGRFVRSLHPEEVRARRWVQMLRAWDARAAGASQREIAAVLLSAEAGQPRWRSRSPSVRSQAQRLLRGAQHMALGGHRALLQ
ncbi:MAG: DUF2285 domain-containing protein [Sphingomonas sp.]|nr:DUF2285 domain-containing protein [Sphingomonas sp.]